ncbi:hypothetical protein AUC69_12405 [Methyloceanibacter superfactus]|uniref:Uncharacterized protein n=1 Tax=Methyloceanibacter superfactus TaxID=1774969 RepID=A0A1E3VWS8_9HYPH|nr:hypothetical protein [Methyloceanibacter superfactus]ODR97406.1 hypothetical protein AUC69_12405 [Methyloceanibacter superfactus]
MEKIELTLDETAEIPGDAFLSPRAGAYFPRRYVTDFFRFIEAHKADLEVITYADFPWGRDWDFDGGYPEERKAWAKELASGKRNPNKAYIILQYDIDSFPERAMGLLREPTQALCPTNVMIFNKRIDRRRLKTTGEVAFTDYDLDDALLRSLSDQGFVIGYHINAFEQALFDTDRALEIFDRDVRELSARFPISFVSAHGGVPGPDGRNNNNMPFHQDWQTKLRWVHNGHSPKFNGQFSDGGHNAPTRDPVKRDLRDFVRTFKPGNRYRILLHPQYYSDAPLPSARYGGTTWYDEIMSESAANSATSLWSDVTLGRAELARPRRSFFGIRWPQ